MTRNVCSNSAYGWRANTSTSRKGEASSSNAEQRAALERLEMALVKYPEAHQALREALVAQGWLT